MNLLKRFDEYHFIGFRLWEFAFKSLFYEYGSLFAKKILFREPVKSLKGLLLYRKIRNSLSEKKEDIFFINTSKKSFLDRLVLESEGLLVAVGYCQKPIKNAANASECPSGLFNHDCLYLSRIDLKNPDEHYPASVCAACDIALLGRKTLSVGGTMHIMTSARDMVYDIFLPSLNHGKYRNAVFILCAYSSEPLILPMAICGIKGILVKYSKGDCRDFDEFIKADGGLKNERTSLNKKSLLEVNHIFDYFLSFRKGETSLPYSRFEMIGNMFVPKP